VPADPTVGGGEERGVDPTMCCRNYQKGVGVFSRQPLKDKVSTEIDNGLLKCFLLLRTVCPAVCNMGVEKSVADCAEALSEAQSKRCMGRGNMIKRRRNP